MFKKNIIEILYFSLVFFIFTILSINLVIYFDIDRHWTHIYDQEFTLAYNALLFNSGILQEFLDHTGYFTILFLSIVILIANFFQFLDFYNITGLLNYNDIDSPIQNLITITRIYAGISVAVWCLAVNSIFYYLSKSKLFAFLLTLVIFSFPGTIFHTSQLRTELYSSLFMILSLIMMISFFDIKHNKYLNTKIFLFFIFTYCAILNKSQFFLYFLGIFFLSLFFYSTITKIGFKFENYKRLKKNLFYTYLIIILYLIFKLSIFSGTYLSLLFIISNILIINFIFYYLAQKSKIEPLEFLINFNIILIFSFIVLKIILFGHPSTNEMAFFNTIINIMDIANYSIYSTSTNESLSQIADYINVLILHFEKVLFYYFKEINIYAILILLIALLSLVFKKKIGNKFFIFNFLCIVIPLLFSFIGSFKGIQIVYHIFWDFILLLPFCIFFKKINLKINYMIILILVLISYNNYKEIINLKNDIIKEGDTKNIIKICNELIKMPKNNYIEDFHKKIPAQKFIKFCLNIEK